MPDGDLRAGAIAAAIDQAARPLRDVAHMLAWYRGELEKAGMHPDEALELCLELQREMIIGPHGEDRCDGLA